MSYELGSASGETAAAIIDRLRAAVGAGSDRALARQLGVSPMAVSNWRTRDSRPYPICVQLAVQQGFSLDWLLLGRGPQRLGVADDARGERQEIGEVLGRIASLGDDAAAALMAELKRRLDVEERLERLERAAAISSDSQATQNRRKREKT